MLYKITHTTKYAYTDPVSICRNQVRLTPRQLATQKCKSHRLEIKPSPARRERGNDYFGNRVYSFSIHRPHRVLTVTATSRVEVQPAPVPDLEETERWERVREMLQGDRSPAGLADYQFAFDSPLVAHDAELATFARESFPAGRPVLAGARDLTARIHDGFRYDPKATTVHTPLREVLKKRRGVCQDFAHVQIGCLRSLGLAARYISGYLRTEPPPGKPRLVGVDASHAWVSVFCGTAGWIDFDPTNDVIVTSNHVTLAWGRDYSDVCPIQGTFMGGGQHKMTVAVDVHPV